MSIKRLSAILFILILFASPIEPACAGAPSSDLTRAKQIAIPVSEQCVSSAGLLLLEDYEQAIENKPAETKGPLFGDCSLKILLSGSSPQTIAIDAKGTNAKPYTGIVVWVKPSTDGVRVSAGISSDRGKFESRQQGLRYSGEVLPAYIDFASMGLMSQDAGKVEEVLITFHPSGNSEVVIDNVMFVDASYGSFCRAWWDETCSKRYVDQRFQETLNDYVSLYLNGHGSTDPDIKKAIIAGIDNIILSRQPDGWVEGRTTGLITAGTIGATLANAYMAMKDDPSMKEMISVYGDSSHTREWWIKKSMDQNVKFIDYVFSMNINGWVVRNQMLEGARATYSAYLATGNPGYLKSYKAQMNTILKGRQDPVGTYPEWTGTYNPEDVMFDASYTAVQFSILMSLAAMGDNELALPMTVDLYDTIQGIIDPSSGMIMNVNSSRKDLTGDLRWQDGLLYYLGTRENLSGFSHLGYIENRLYEGKSFPADFHSALGRYYDLKYYMAPAQDNGYRLPLEAPYYSICQENVRGDIARSSPSIVRKDGFIINPSVTRERNTFPQVNPFFGEIKPSGSVSFIFSNDRILADGMGLVNIVFTEADLEKMGAGNRTGPPLYVCDDAGVRAYTGHSRPDGSIAYTADIKGLSYLSFKNDAGADPGRSTDVTPVPHDSAGNSMPSVSGLLTMILILLAAILCGYKRIKA